MNDPDEHTKEIVRDILEGMGFKNDKDDPDAMYKDMLYIRKRRKGREDLHRLVRRSAISVSVPAVLYFLWEVFKGSLTK